jgi:dinuclear metal center YbgI/SA1388 family protein
MDRVDETGAQATGKAVQGTEPMRQAAGGAMRSVDRAVLSGFLDSLLEPRRFSDYCPNGLQAEGKPRIAGVVCGVTASLALVKGVAQSGADAILVHHGWFWRGDDPRVIGPRRERLATLLAHDINLYAYHLPLDVHPEVGNNVALARHLGWPQGEAFGRDGLMRMAQLDQPTDVASLSKVLQDGLGQAPLAVGDLSRPIRRIAWCTGAAQDFLQDAIDAGADAFVSGEISERTTHLAREAGVVYLAAGHHATERFGVQALGQRVADAFSIPVRFIDDPNPV